MVLFDGICNFCNASVAFIIARDPAADFSFASLQSDAARRLLGQVNTVALVPDSMVLVERGRIFTRSDAALRIARGLGFPWSLAFALMVVPRPVRNWVYDVVARNRYRWFGKRDTCMVPTPDVRGRFLE